MDDAPAPPPLYNNTQYALPPRNMYMARPVISLTQHETARVLKT